MDDDEDVIRYPPETFAAVRVDPRVDPSRDLPALHARLCEFLASADVAYLTAQASSTTHNSSHNSTTTTTTHQHHHERNARDFRSRINAHDCVNQRKPPLSSHPPPPPQPSHNNLQSWRRPARKAIFGETSSSSADRFVTQMLNKLSSSKYDKILLALREVLASDASMGARIAASALDKASMQQCYAQLYVKLLVDLSVPALGNDQVVVPALGSFVASLVDSPDTWILHEGHLGVLARMDDSDYDVFCEAIAWKKRAVGKNHLAVLLITRGVTEVSAQRYGAMLMELPEVVVRNDIWLDLWDAFFKTFPDARVHEAMLCTYHRVTGGALTIKNKFKLLEIANHLDRPKNGRMFSSQEQQQHGQVSTSVDVHGMNPERTRERLVAAS